MNWVHHRTQSAESAAEHQINVADILREGQSVAQAPHGLGVYGLMSCSTHSISFLWNKQRFKAITHTSLPPLSPPVRPVWRWEITVG